MRQGVSDVDSGEDIRSRREKSVGRQLHAVRTLRLSLSSGLHPGGPPLSNIAVYGVELILFDGGEKTRTMIKPPCQVKLRILA